VPAARCEWLVPGLLKEKVRALAKSIPQRLRNKLGPLEEFAAAFAAKMQPSDTPLAQALARHIRAELGLEVPLDAFRPDSAPPHLHMNFLVIDEHGRQLGMSRNLAELKRELGRETEAQLQPDADLRLHTGWTMGDLAEMMEIERGGQTLVGYPALVDAGDGVTLQVFDTPERAAELHRAGVRRLLAIAFKERIRDLERAWAKDLALAPLKEDLVAAALERVFLADAVPTLAAEFARAVEAGRSRFMLVTQEVARTAAGILAAHAELKKKLAPIAKSFPQAAQDIEQQLARLVASGWLAATPWARLQHYPRYLRAIELRLEKLKTDPARDARLMSELAPLLSAWRRAPRPLDAEQQQFGWLLEELRVSLFAQQLKTPVPVSAKRLAKLWQSIRR
jgi:ATP-dependent helicase HrpA